MIEKVNVSFASRGHSKNKPCPVATVI